MTPDVIERIQSGWRMHQRWQRAENALVLQGKAICRSWTDGDKVAATKLFDAFRSGEEIDQTLAMALLPFGPAIDQFVPLKKQLLKEITVLARQLPAMAWVKDVHNFGDKSFATIIGEAGDLSNYSTHSKLWRRMGMAPFAKNGVTRSGKQWKVAGGLNADDWSEFGYSGRRRSVMFVVEGCLFKGGPYREIALARKDYLRQRAEIRGLKVAASAKIPKKERDQYVSVGQIHQQAMHYMGKKLLRDLWQAWRRAAVSMPARAKPVLPAAVDSDAPSGAWGGRPTPARKGRVLCASPLIPMPLRRRVSANPIVPKGQPGLADTHSFSLGGLNDAD
jgi:hypothetical protein